MAVRRRRQSKSICDKCADLVVAVPQVIAHRVARAALAAPILSQRDLKEFQRMASEKPAAFAESGWQMALQMYRLNQQILGSMSRMFWAPHSLDAFWTTSAATQMQRAGWAVFDKGLAPIHRRAVSNVKRLAKTSLC
jgi:hypothetical protein